MKSDYQNKRCYICGKLGADTKDHVPPKCIFLNRKKGIGLNLITVPAHSDCNNALKMEDEYFRFGLSIPGYWNSEDARELWDTKTLRGLNKPEAAKFKKSIVDKIFTTELKSN